MAEPIDLAAFLEHEGKVYTSETTRWRDKAHQAFDQLWRGPSATMKRKEAYAWLSKAMDLPSHSTHIKLMTEEQCKRVVALVDVRLSETRSIGSTPTPS